MSPRIQCASGDFWFEVGLALGSYVGTDVCHVQVGTEYLNKDGGWLGLRILSSEGNIQRFGDWSGRERKRQVLWGARLCSWPGPPFLLSQYFVLAVRAVTLLLIGAEVLGVLCLGGLCILGDCLTEVHILITGCKITS